MNVLPYMVALWLFAVGWYGVATSRHLIRTTVCLAVVQSTSYLLLLGVGYRIGGTAPVFLDVPPGTPAVDPVVQALTLTDIVVSAAAFALLLALAIQARDHSPTLDPDELTEQRG